MEWKFLVTFETRKERILREKEAWRNMMERSAEIGGTSTRRPTRCVI